MSAIDGASGAGKIAGLDVAATRPSATDGVDAAAGAHATSFSETVSAVAASGQVHGVTALERLHAGTIDVAGYIEAHIGEATKPLEGMLPAADLEAIADELRTALSLDPALAALVRRAESGE